MLKILAKKNTRKCTLITEFEEIILALTLNIYLLALCIS